MLAELHSSSDEAETQFSVQAWSFSYNLMPSHSQILSLSLTHGSTIRLQIYRSKSEKAKDCKCTFPALCGVAAWWSWYEFRSFSPHCLYRSFCGAGEIIINLHKGKQRWRVAWQATFSPQNTRAPNNSTHLSCNLNKFSLTSLLVVQIISQIILKWGNINLRSSRKGKAVIPHTTQSLSHPKTSAPDHSIISNCIWHHSTKLFHRAINTGTRGPDHSTIPEAICTNLIRQFLFQH